MKILQEHKLRNFLSIMTPLFLGFREKFKKNGIYPSNCFVFVLHIILPRLLHSADSFR